VIDDEIDERWRAMMRDAQDGDRALYASLLRELLVPLRRFCRRRLPTLEDAEDVVQDILITVHKARATYDPARPFRPWLSTIARRRIADRLTAMRRSGAHAPLEAADEVTFEAAGPNRTDGVLTAAELQAAIATLPQAQRSALELTKLKEMSLAEASAASGMTVGSLKVATHRAVAALRKRFAGLKE
jgi:RNA polymerase sigma-70 factor (ECF subfamily)